MLYNQKNYQCVCSVQAEGGEESSSPRPPRVGKTGSAGYLPVAQIFPSLGGIA